MGIKTWNVSALTLICFSEKPPHHMGIKTDSAYLHYIPLVTLKNLPTTWGLRLFMAAQLSYQKTLKNLPTTWGLRPKPEVKPEPKEL